MLRLNWLGCQVDGGSEPFTNAQIIVRENEATVSRGSNVLAQRFDAVGIEDTGARSRTVTFADGAVWVVVLPERKSGCGCK